MVHVLQIHCQNFHPNVVHFQTFKKFEWLISKLHRDKHLSFLQTIRTVDWNFIHKFTNKILVYFLAISLCDTPKAYVWAWSEHCLRFRLAISSTLNWIKATATLIMEFSVQVQFKDTSNLRVVFWFEKGLVITGQVQFLLCPFLEPHHWLLTLPLANV